MTCLGEDGPLVRTGQPGASAGQVCEAEVPGPRPQLPLAGEVRQEVLAPHSLGQVNKAGDLH